MLEKPDRLLEMMKKKPTSRKRSRLVFKLSRHLKRICRDIHSVCPTQSMCLVYTTYRKISKDTSGNAPLHGLIKLNFQSNIFLDGNRGEYSSAKGSFIEIFFLFSIIASDPHSGHLFIFIFYLPIS